MEVRHDGTRCGDGADRRPDRPGPGRRRRRVRRADGTAPPRAAGALLPDARVGPGRRRRPPGDAARRVAGPRGVRRAGVAADVAVPHRHQSMPQRPSHRQPPTGRSVERPRRRAAGADAVRRGGLARAVPRRPPRRRVRRPTRTGGSLRGDGVDRPGLRDRSADASPTPARGGRAPRRARVSRQRRRRDARVERRVGQQRPQTSPRRPAATHAGGRGSHGGLLRRRGPTTRSSPSSFAPTRPPISTRWSPC